MKRIFPFIVLALFCSAPPSSAVTHHVGQDGVARGYELNETIYGSADGDTILVYPGTYVGAYIYAASKDLVIRSVEGPEKTILDGDKALMVAWFLHVTDKTVLEGFTIRNGYDPRFSGGIRCGGDAIIRNNIIEGCQSGWGGGVYVAPQKKPTIEGNLFRNNISTTAGGGIYAQFSRPVIRNNTFVGNNAEIGGDDIALYGTSAVVENNLFTGNKGLSSIYLKGDKNEITLDCNAFWNIKGQWIAGEKGAVIPEDGNRKTADPGFADTQSYSLGASSPYGKSCSCGPIGWRY
ncbi:MAG: right-handed parallel beta-helix repeat-containing protein [Candidatus Eisenbacteria bacterium]|nr:right-handed parallel beta-helix repeat-containing protein [Candidatus Eisenbacteria bacterium]